MPNEVVLITGCSTGIGRALVTHLAGLGYQVVATARKPDTLAELPAALKLPLDVERPESVEAAVDQTIRTFGRIDVLVNNAGYGQLGALEELSDAQLRKVFEVNVFGLMRMVRAVVPPMRKQGRGRIINLSSVAGRVSIPIMGAYSGTKFAVEAMSDALRGELDPFGIKVVLIEPGAIQTQFESTARASATDVLARSDSPYRKLYAGAQEMLGGQNKGAPGPDAVARVIARAIGAPRPRARYQVPFSASLMVAFIRLLPTRLMDWGVRSLIRRVNR